MIKAVLFDYGGVLARSGKLSGSARVSSKFYGLNEARIELKQSRRLFLKALVHGDVKSARLLKKIFRSGRIAKWLLFWNRTPTFVKNESVYNLAAELRKSGIRTGILSNVFTVVADEHKRRGDYDGFDPFLLSCEIHLAKPDVEFYKLALDKLNLPAHEVLFIDDKPVNLVPARHLGMRTILAETSQQIVSDIRKILETENNILL